MAMCNITGFLYNATGQVITTGVITLQLQQDMVFNNQKVAPFTLTIDLSTTGGYVDWTVFPTVGATPTGIMYKLEAWLLQELHQCSRPGLYCSRRLHQRSSWSAVTELHAHRRGRFIDRR
jgi:hypothetical protein